MGENTLAKIARALVTDLRKNLTVDWLSRKRSAPHWTPISAAYSRSTTTRPTRGERQWT